ncbi:uncharacterized protein BCR38DRAFT_475297 [Pseudomassariella vexata]|uniref:Uncharacterized protein n=1 Tax=Pseudomassariella vexata TaxID=1141098 RepID=A0A1Y2DVM5_9PEZI|nr:uncharacterized protein BCR38DRAFT_475297 [Pseudomassariella vexata]ORY63321.1 hypothetical protein BCR38DRAFT_475297 [Pseudomassariella vexata]
MHVNFFSSRVVSKGLWSYFSSVMEASEEGQVARAYQVNEVVLSKYGLSRAEWQSFKDFQKAHEEFHKWLESRNLAPDETKATSCRTNEDFTQLWTGLAEQSHFRFDERHQKGIRRWTRKYQGFSKGVSSFMQDISPMLDIVNGLFPPASGFAVGTISGLFKANGLIAERKSYMEEQTWAAIEEVKDRLPGFRMYQEIYSEEADMNRDLRKKIVFAYMAFVELSMSITKYYLQPGYVRWMSALSNPGKFQYMTDRVNMLVVGIRTRCEELQSLSISQLRESNKSLLDKLENIERDKAITHLMQLQELLGVPEWTPEAQQQNLAHYRRLLDYERDRESIYEQMRSGSVERFQSESDFAEWKSSKASKFLVLIGVNHRSISEGKRHCWISPIALDLGDRLSRNPLAFFALYVFPPLQSTSIHIALPILLVQLLRLLRSKLAGNEQLEGLLAAAKYYSGWKDQGDKDDDTSGHLKKLEALTSLTTRCIRLLEPNETVYLILDRVDQCQEEDQYDLVRILVDMMSQVQCTVKVLMVADHVAWRVNLKAFKLQDSTEPKEVVLQQQYLVRKGY